MKKYLLLLPLFVLACSLWTPYAAMQAPQPTPRAGGVPGGETPTDTATPTPAPKSCQVTAAEALNLRSGPGTSYPVIAWLQPGDVLTITQQSNGWVQVTTPTGAAGWVNSNYCKGR
jgi:uncharacterized protein YgiM (DUF1202 family)